MTNYKLHKLPEGFIVTCDEIATSQEYGFNGKEVVLVDLWKNRDLAKVIASQNWDYYNLPEINFSALSEEEIPNVEEKVEVKIEQIQQKYTSTIDNSNRVSSLSIKGLKQKADVSNLAKTENLAVGEHLADPFTQEDAKKHWDDYIEILETKGKKLFASYMRLSKPVLMGTNILLEFPNQGSKEDFENTNSDLISYLKTNLRNYDVKIKITVIETYKPKVIYTNEEKYKHFKELNPNIELFRQTFELDL